MEPKSDFLPHYKEESVEFKRRNLLPIWIKVFCWIFIVSGAITPIGLILGLLGYKFQVAFYGLETNEPISWIGLTLMAIFLIKGIIAFGLWTGKEWAIRFAKIDAIGGIIICIFVMLVTLFSDNFRVLMFTFRLELILLIPYLIKLRKIDYYWTDPE